MKLPLWWCPECKSPQYGFQSPCTVCGAEYVQSWHCVRCGRIGLVVFLLPDVLNADESAALKARQFPLDGPSAHRGEFDELSDEETTIRLAVQQPQQSLLGRCEQRIGQ